MKTAPVLWAVRSPGWLEGCCSPRSLPQKLSHPVTERLDLATRWHVSRLKHGRLHAWSRARIRLAPIIPG